LTLPPFFPLKMWIFLKFFLFFDKKKIFTTWSTDGHTNIGERIFEISWSFREILILEVP
jgi:hypothetical protein